MDGLKGFPEAIHTVFPETTVQTSLNTPRTQNSGYAQLRHLLTTRDAFEVKRRTHTELQKLSETV